MTDAKPRQRQTVSLQLTPSPLDAAILIVLAERESGGSRPDVGAVISRLARAEISAIFGRDVLAVAGDIAAELKIHLGADPPLDARGTLREGLRAHLRRRAAPASECGTRIGSTESRATESSHPSASAPPASDTTETAAELAVADKALRARRRAAGLDPDTGTAMSHAEERATTSGGPVLRAERKSVKRSP